MFVLTSETLINLVDRINKLEQETKELRGLLADARKEFADEIEEARQSFSDHIPTLQDDGKLVFETYDNDGNTVYGHVVAEIQSDQSK